MRVCLLGTALLGGDPTRPLSEALDDACFLVAFDQAASWDAPLVSRFAPGNRDTAFCQRVRFSRDEF